MIINFIYVIYSVYSIYYGKSLIPIKFHFILNLTVLYNVLTTLYNVLTILEIRFGV